MKNNHSSPVRPRIGGGMNQNLGNFSGEHFDESVATQARNQKAQAQAAADPGQSPVSGQSGDKSSSLSTDSQHDKVRSLDPKLEPKRFLTDLKKGLFSLLDIRSALTLDEIKDSPEERAKKQKIHQNFEKMTAAEQEEVRRRLNEETEKKKIEEQKKQEEKSKKEQEEDNQLIVPSSPQKGPVGPAGSKKQKASQMVNQQRQGIGRVAGAN